jgi:cardiolipin synthase
MATWQLLYYISEWAVRFIMLIYVPQKRSAAAARGWLLMIFLLPWPGVILYALIGRPYLPKRRVALQAKISKMIKDEQALRSAGKPMEAVANLPPQFSHVVKLAQNLGDFQIFAGNEIELIDDYEVAIDRIVADIDSAVHHAHLLYYIFADDRTGNKIADALIRAVSRGVSCRVLMDGRGSRSGLNRLGPKLREKGVEVVALLPGNVFRRFTASRIDLRNHRKIVVIDGKLGYVGSQNIIDADFKKPLVYEEVVVRVAGPVVAEMQAVLLADRLVETGEPVRHPLMFPELPPQTGIAAQLLPSGPGYPHENNQRFIVSLLHAATQRIVITSPYFIPDDPFIQAMTTAVLRGVEVHLVVSKQIDQYLVGLGQRSFYDELLEGGVRIHSYTKRFLHAKHVSIDDCIALIGSSNMDIRSFMLNAEVMLVVYDQKIVADLKRIQDRYFADSEEVSAQAWRERPVVYRVLQNTARLADSLL